MKKNKIICCIGTLAMASIALHGCNKQDVSKEEEIRIEQKDTQKLSIKEEKIERVSQQKKVSKEFSQGMNQFSFRMFEELEEGENLFISPYSIAMALSMVDNGADTETKKEIEEMLGITDLTKWNEDINFYLTKTWNKSTYLKNANSLWISEQMKLAQNAEQEYFQVVSKYFGAEKYYMALDTTEAKESINKWVKKNTSGMIEKMLQKNLSSQTRMALFNAIYFEGKWEKKFLEENTDTQLFYGKEKETEVDMMCLEDENFSYVEKNGLHAVELPYKNSSMVMDVILPVEEDEDVVSLFFNLTEEEKTKFFQELSNAEPQKITKLCIPKFETEYTGNEKVKEALQKLGMKSAFYPNTADFSKISDESLFISEVIHKAKIQVEENGTKAAATTGLIFKENCAIDLDPLIFVADHPYIYVIRDVKENIIVFMGIMYDME